MPIHLRQIALVAGELEPVLADLTEVLGIRSCYVDEAVAIWGLENNLMPIGTDMLEVVAPTTSGTAAGRYLERRGGDGGYMVITQADSAATQAACRQRAIENKVRVAYEREREDSHLMQLHPADMVASFLEIDSDRHGDFSGYWHPAGGMGWQEHVDQSRTHSIIGAQLQSPDPEALAAHWAAVIGASVGEKDGMPAVALANAKLQFVEERDDRGPGLSGVFVSVSDRAAVLEAAHRRNAYVSDDQVQLCGTHFFLNDAAAS